ncbi:MAG: outer membrane lipoprotein-sorting protein [Spirochaetes bacterium]|nr:outer membrane lipoprotein-sorting protein [Spirochaetota bacterium]
MKKYLIFLLLIIGSIFLLADTKADEVARRHFNLKQSNDQSSIRIMVLINRNNEKKVRKIESFSRKGKNGQDTFMRFVEPAQVLNTTFLSFGYDDGDDEQRIFLPGLGKIRKISASNKDQKFMGSDLFYYDMEDFSFNDFTYKYVKEDEYKGIPCDVIEMYPKDRNAPYSKQVCWISKIDSFSYKVECYDKKRLDLKTKTIVSLSVKAFKGILIPEQMVIDNHKENHKTLLQDSNIQVNIGLSPEIFTIQNMEK